MVTVVCLLSVSNGDEGMCVCVSLSAIARREDGDDDGGTSLAVVKCMDMDS